MCVCRSDHRHSSHHTRHPLSKHTDGRKKKTGKKKRGKETHPSVDLSVQEEEEEEEKHSDKPESEKQDGVQVSVILMSQINTFLCYNIEFVPYEYVQYLNNGPIWFLLSAADINDIVVLQRSEYSKLQQ